ncbi:MAG: hypothetical protein Q8O55_06830 [Dehalococcoidales bacterium]|nr:hypothetical protein [Dehalococcoidales bacterium]
MGIAPSMRDLAQNIASSHEDRTKAVLEIMEGAERVTGDAQDLIKGFQTSRTQSGNQLRKDLARDKANRKSSVKKMLGDAQGLINDLQVSRRKESAHLRKELAQGSAERRSEVSTILGDARQIVSTFQSHRKEAGSKLREELAQSRSSRESEVGDLLKGARDLVSDLGKSRQETGKKLRKDLAGGRADRESAVKEMRSGFHKSQAAVRADISEARDAWQELTRGVTKSTVKAEVAKAVPAEEETPDLEAKLLAAIREHPQGITLSEVAENLGVAPIVFGRAARKLVDEGRVHKEDKTYFPVTSE